MRAIRPRPCWKGAGRGWKPGGVMKRRPSSCRPPPYSPPTPRRPRGRRGCPRQLGEPLGPALPLERVPIDHITNGVHVPTWIDPKMELRCAECGGPDWLAEEAKTATREGVGGISSRAI